MADSEKPSRVRVAVTQAEPEWLDLDATVQKTCALIEEAASNGAKLISFPECWVAGYPAWIWSRVVDFNLSKDYIKQSLKAQSPEMDKICACAETSAITVVLGFSENWHGSLYIAQCIIGADGKIGMHRRKIKPTHMERTVFGDASGDCLQNVVDTDVGRVGALACWEHAQPLLKYHTCLQHAEIHVSAWPPLDQDTGPPDLWSTSREGCRNLSRTYAIESQSFVLHTTSVITQKGIERMNTAAGAMMKRPGGGGSAIYGPDGRQLSEDFPESEEGILYADLDMDEILKAKVFLDVGGHYSRPDILWLGVDGKEKKHLVLKEETL